MIKNVILGLTFKLMEDKELLGLDKPLKIGSKIQVEKGNIYKPLFETTKCIFTSIDVKEDCTEILDKFLKNHKIDKEMIYCLLDRLILDNKLDCPILYNKHDNIWRDSAVVLKLLDGMITGRVKNVNSYLKKNGVKRWYK